MCRDGRIHFAPHPVHVRRLHRADVVLSTGDDDPHAVDDDLLGRDADRHEPRSTLAVDRLRRHADGPAGGECRIASEVHAGRAAREHRADDHVIDVGGIEPGTIRRMAERMGHERR